MSTSTHPIIVLSNSNVEDAFSSTNTPDYTPASPNYSPASLRNTSSDPLKDLSKDLLASLAISPLHDDPYIKIMQAYNPTNDESPILLPQAPIAPPTVLPPSLVLPLSPISHKTSLKRHEEQIETILNHLDELPLERIEHMEDKIEGLGNGRGDLEYDFTYTTTRLAFDKLSKWSGMAPKRTPTFAAPTMSQASIRKLVAAALEVQAATMTNTNNTTRNTGPRETLVARKCSYKEFMSFQSFNFKGTEGAVGLIRWFEQTESIFLCSNYTKDCKVKFVTGTLTKESLSCWNSFAQPIGIEEAYKIT
ncbi:hypothetical protein Tco_1474616 [Tanacetum coccineum]